MTWRTTSIILGVLLAWQTWRGCTRRACPTPPAATAPAAGPAAIRATGGPRDDDRAAEAADTPRPASGDGFSFYGFRVQVPGWVWPLLPQSGEPLRAYRDRMLPLARAALGPHRERVARSRDDLARELGLDARQRAELDAAAAGAAEAIQARLFGAALGGEFLPRTFKPMVGVSVARDVIDTVDDAGKRFSAVLSEDQRARMATHPFDFGDYLLFSTKWEDVISGL